MADLIGIKLTVLPDTQAQAHQVIERLAAVVTGLALEGIDSNMQITPYESEEDE
jgi:hypothetical protein